MLRLPSRRRTTTWRPNACATPAPHASARPLSRAALWLWPTATQTTWSSADQRPPTSMASTTNLARDRGPTNSGYVRSFHLLAACNTPPSASAAEPCVTITVEGAHELTSPKQGKAVHHDLQRLSNGLGATRSRSRTNTLVVTRPPASGHMRAAALSKANPLRPKTPNRGHAVVAKRIDWTAETWAEQSTSWRPGRPESAPGPCHVEVLPEMPVHM